MVTGNRLSDSPQAFDLAQRTQFPSHSQDEATILFATDLSSSSRVGVNWATLLARLCGAKVLLLHVETPPASSDHLHHDYSQVRSRSQSALQSLLPTDPAVRSNYHVVLGDPAQQIVDVAEQKNVSLIVLGTHQRKGLQRILKGSVTESVLRYASCPVFVFPLGSAG